MTAPQTGQANTAASRTSGLDWLLDDFVTRVAGVRAGLVLSSDGVPTGASKEIAPEDAEHLAALASGFHSLAGNVGERFASGPTRQTVVELEEAFLFVCAAGSGSCLAVFADTDSDMDLVAYEMTLLVRRVGDHLGTAERAGAPTGGGARG